jgi:DsbE subfamily thiol:disulfide oxidoreductase
MRRLIFILPLTLVIVLGAIFLYRLFMIERGQAPNILPSALLDKPAPDFVLPPLKADKPGLASADFIGQVTVVNFFASWCAPCRVEHPLFMRLAREGKVNLVGVAYKDKPEDAIRWLAELGDPFRRIGVDRDGKVALNWGLYGVPETYVVDASGKVRFRWPGAMTDQIWAEQVVPLLAGTGR